MSKYIIDIEGTLIPKDTRVSRKIHCIGVENFETKEYKAFTSVDNFEGFIDYISDAEYLVAHKGIDYDFPTLKKHIPGYAQLNHIEHDSLVICRLLFPDILLYDNFLYPKKLRGRHSLEAWGVRLKYKKIDYKGGFDRLTPEMVEYMEGDVRLLSRLWDFILKNAYPGLFENLEEDYKMTSILGEIKEYGIKIDVEKLIALEEELKSQINSHIPKLKELYPPRYSAKTWEYIENPENPSKYKNLTKKQKKNFGYHLNPPKDYKREFFAKHTKREPQRSNIILEEFNPNSRDQCANRLIQDGWRPIKFTATGLVEISYETMEEMKGQNEAAKHLFELMMLNKRLAYVASDKEKGSSLKQKVYNGRIYPNITHSGAMATQRCSHSSPNLSQATRVVLSNGKPLRGLEGEYGWDIRELIIPDNGYVLVGGDISSLEAVVYGEYLFPYDNGEMLKIVSDPTKSIHNINLESIHRAGRKIANKEVSSLVLKANRNIAKSVYYAISYGAGDRKVGHTISPLLSDSAKILVGKLVKKELTEGIKGAKLLLEDLANAADSDGFLTIYGHRRIKVPSARVALNRLIQSSGAYIAKHWVIRTDELMKKHHIDGRIVIFSHDELQIQVSEGKEEKVYSLLQEAMDHTCKKLNLKTMLNIDTQAGKSWAETH